MPPLADTVTNGMPRTIRRTPVHRLLSSRYCLLEFTGRRTGRSCRVPVAYVEHGCTLWVSTDSRWWRNLVGATTFVVRLRGQARAATARRVRGERAVAALAQLVAIPGYPRAAGIARVDGVGSSTAEPGTRRRCHQPSPSPRRCNDPLNPVSVVNRRVARLDQTRSGPAARSRPPLCRLQ